VPGAGQQAGGWGGAESAGNREARQDAGMVSCCMSCLCPSDNILWNHGGVLWMVGSMCRKSWARCQGDEGFCLLQIQVDGL
jgi:hypothetical protein